MTEIAEPSTTFRKWLVAIVVVGLVIRVLDALWLQHVGGFMIADSYVYHREGIQVANGQGWVNPLLLDLFGLRRELAMHPPAYSLWLAGWSWLGFTSTFAHQLVTIPIGCATIVALGLVGRRFIGPGVGLTAAAIAAVNPSIWSWEGMLLQEPMAMLATTLLIGALLMLRDQISARSVLLTGLATGCALLTRAEISVAAAICLVVLVLRRRDRRSVVAVGTVVVVAALMVLPWSIHNSMRFSRPVPISNGLGVTLSSTNCDQTMHGLLGYWSIECSSAAARRASAEWFAEHPDADVIDVGAPVATLPDVGGDISVGVDNLPQAQYLQYPELDEAEVDSRVLSNTLTWMKDHPTDVLKSIPARLGRVLGLYHPLNQMAFDRFVEGRKRPIVLAAWSFYYLMLPFTIAGAIILWRRNRGQSVVLLAPIAASLFVVALTFGNTRYRAIAEPSFAVLAAVGIVGAATWVSSTWRDAPSPESPSQAPSPE